MVGSGLRDTRGHPVGPVTAALGPPLAAFAALGTIGLARLAGGLHFGCGELAVTIGIGAGEHLRTARLAVGSVDHAVAIGIHAGETFRAGGLHFGQRDTAVAIGIGIMRPAVLRDRGGTGQRQCGGGKGKDGLVHRISPKVWRAATDRGLRGGRSGPPQLVSLF